MQEQCCCPSASLLQLYCRQLAHTQGYHTTQVLGQIEIDCPCGNMPGTIKQILRGGCGMITCLYGILLLGEAGMADKHAQAFAAQFLLHDSAAIHPFNAPSMQEDRGFKEEQIGALVIWIGALKKKGVEEGGVQGRLLCCWPSPCDGGVAQTSFLNAHNLPASGFQFAQISRMMRLQHAIAVRPAGKCKNNLVASVHQQDRGTAEFRSRSN
eukprot:1145936-Pelagomonas_calceolata.AAC.4